MKRFRLFAMAATAMTYFLIFVGGLVRVSGAGLGCPDWPTCFGRWIPPTDVNQLPADIDASQFNFALAWIEYVNRLIGVTVGLLIAATAVWVLVSHRRQKRLLVPSVLAAVLVAYQGWQGSQVVLSGLDSMLISIHMGIAFVIAGLMTYLTQQAYYLETGISSGKASAGKELRLWVVLLAVVSVVQVVSGTQMRAGLWEVSQVFALLPTSEWLSRLGTISTLHTILGCVMVIVTLWVGARIIRSLSESSVLGRQATWTAMILAALQVAIGALMAMAGVPPVLQLFHLLISGLYVGMLVLSFSALHYEGRVL